MRMGERDRQQSFAYGINYHSEEGRKESVYCFLRLTACYYPVQPFVRSAIISCGKKVTLESLCFSFPHVSLDFLTY